MTTSFLHLFEGYGVELEYAIVDRDTLNVLPIADELIFSLNNHSGGEVDLGEVGLSNELAKHLAEFKSMRPIANLDQFSAVFHQHIQKINALLAPHHAVLMPTSCHPWMDPMTESGLWTHDDYDIYNAYDRIFNCKRHGWLNVQSVHLNLPFFNDSEFEKLHAAIRLVMPLIPAISASSPIIHGAKTELLDTRLKYYISNQEKIPSITGSLIPEAIFNALQYQTLIFDKIYRDIRDYDKENILQHEWLNSRGAIARFDRQTIEIRIIDIQECPKADLAILSFLVAIIRLLISERWINLKTQKLFSEKSLLPILLKTMTVGQKSRIENELYLSAFGYSARSCLVSDLLGYLLEIVVSEGLFHNEEYISVIRTILEKGCLSERILEAVNDDFSRENLKNVYGQLVKCLENNRMF